MTDLPPLIPVNSLDLNHSHEHPVVKVGWTYHPSPPRGDAPDQKYYAFSSLWRGSVLWWQRR